MMFNFTSKYNTQYLLHMPNMFSAFLEFIILKGGGGYIKYIFSQCPAVNMASIVKRCFIDPSNDTRNNSSVVRWILNAPYLGR